MRNGSDSGGGPAAAGVSVIVLMMASAGGLLAHAAVLVLLAAAARTRLVPADLLRPVADRLGLLVALLAVGDGRVLLPAHALLAGHRPRGRLVDRRADGP